MGCDPMAARSLCDAFDAALKFYDTDTQDPDYRHLASLPDYLGKAATEEQFKLLRYFASQESSIDNPALEYMYVEFHYEILLALGEVLLPRRGTIFDRVEEAARRAFLDTQRLASLASHSEASKEAYTRSGWRIKGPTWGHYYSRTGRNLSRSITYFLRSWELGGGATGIQAVESGYELFASRSSQDIGPTLT